MHRGRRRGPSNGQSHPKVVDDAPLDGPAWARGLLDALELRRVRDPFSAEAAAALVAAAWLPGPFDPQLPVTTAESMIDAVGSVRRTDALVLLRGLAAVAPDPLAARAGAVAAMLADTGVREPKWGPLVGQAAVTGCWRMHHVLGDGDNIVIGCRYPDGQEHSLVVYIDHNLGGLVKDAVPAGPPAEVLAVFAEAVEGDPDMAIDAIEEADVAARLRAALEVTDRAVPPVESDDYPAIRPVLDARLAVMPDGGQVPGPAALSEVDRDALVRRFLGSWAGSRWADDDHAAAIAGLLVRFRCDEGDGAPLRWSPPVVELLLTDWWPRRVAADPDVSDKVPDVLADWVRFAADETGLRRSHVADTLTAIEMFTDEFRVRVAPVRPTAGAVASAAAARLLAAGADPDDPGSWRDALRAQDNLRDDLVAHGEPSPQPVEPDPFVWRAIPTELHERVETIVTACDRTCEQVLDGEYQDLARRLVAKLARKRPSPLRRGDPTIWAAGILHALGQVNFLFARRAPCHISGTQLAEVVGVRPGTAAQKATMVRDAAGLRELDPEFTRRDLAEMEPLLVRFLYRY